MGDTRVMLDRLSLDYKSEKEHFKKVGTLGSGASGYVDLCSVEEEKSYAKRGDKVAVKRIKSVSDTEMAKKEAMVLKKLNHPYIVRYLDNFKDSLGQFCIVMDYCDKGTLEDWLTSRSVKPLEEFNIWRLVRMISSALSFLHSQHPPIIHNDLMPANILCQTNPKYPDSENTDIKIADFGVCNVPGRTRSAMWSYWVSQLGGTVCYLAPEVLRGDDADLTTSADMWSLGAVISYAANREHLFQTERDVFSWRGARSPLERQFKYPQLDQLVLSLLSLDKEDRPTAAQVQEDITNHLERTEE